MSQNRLMRHLVAVAALGAFATVGCFVVDDKDDDDEGGGGEAGEESGGSGGSSNGGSSTGGTSKGGSSSGGSSTGGSSPSGGSSSGGSSSGGASTGGSSAGGTSGTGPGEGAVMKFCNDLWLTNPETEEQVAAEITLTFAGVEATALSGTCSPVVPNPCIEIPAVVGPDVVLTDTADGTEIISGTIPTLTVADGDEILAVATVNEATGDLTVDAGQFLEQYTCAETDPYADTLETRSTPFRLPAAHDLRAQNPAASRWVKKAVAPGIGR
jgi:hypothetical protein